jgi:hypothetical protein
MPMMAYHDVKDKDHWLASPKREEFFGPLGVTNIRTFVDPENPTRVGLVMDVADMDAVMAAMETQPAADAMTRRRPSRDAGDSGRGVTPAIRARLRPARGHFLNWPRRRSSRPGLWCE